VSGLGPLVLSFEVASAGLLLAALVGIPLAGLMASSRGRWPDLVEGFVTVPMVLPPTVLGYYLLVALGRNSPLGSAFEAATGSPLVFSRSGAVVATFFGALPLVVKATRAAMEEVDPSVVGAARTLGASPLRVFVSIVVPLSRGGILAGLTLGFARGLGDFGVTLMLAGNIPGLTQTASLAIYDAVQAGREATTQGMVVTLTALAFLAVYASNRIARKRRHAI
jgi:molybdate transport system permease protein